MNEKEAREISRKFKNHSKGIPSPYTHCPPTTNYAQAKGYLEAIKKTKVLVDTLGCLLLVTRGGQKKWCEIALTEWEKEK